MRRKEFRMEDEAEVTAFLQEMSFGYLGMTGSDGWPYVIPLNFAYAEGKIYLHGSRIGEKISCLSQDDKVTFSVAKEYAILPSYFTDPVFACPATSYFKSVFIKGHAKLLQDTHDKAKALSVFMAKLQPEGGYAPIDADDPKYVPRINGVSVIEITIADLQAKFKFGQNLKEADRQTIISRLHERDAEYDEETIRLMKQFCPHHS